jgi:hypothetical protein
MNHNNVESVRHAVFISNLRKKIYKGDDQRHKALLIQKRPPNGTDPPFPAKPTSGKLLNYNKLQLYKPRFTKLWFRDGASKLLFYDPTISVHCFSFSLRFVFVDMHHVLLES